MNFQVKNGLVIASTPEGDKLIKCPTERVEYVDRELTWDAAPYDAKLQNYDLSGYGLMPIEEEYLRFVHGL